METTFHMKLTCPGHDIAHLAIDFSALLNAGYLSHWFDLERRLHLEFVAPFNGLRLRDGEVLNAQKGRELDSAWRYFMARLQRQGATHA